MPISKLRPSFTLTEDRLKELQAVVPEAFADGRINWDTLREALGETLEDETKEHFGLFWPGKREARRLAALPSKGTLIPQPGAGVDEDSTHNLFIEGDNLEVLKLLQKSYAGRVKMVYIDPPYNTGNDFVYPDDYSEPLEAYLERTGQVDESGQLLTTNSRASGRYHSNWLNMIYPRLLLAKGLLNEDGVVFVSINDDEFPRLRQIMDEMYGEESFVGTFIWKSRHNVDSRNKTGISSDHEYVVCYGQKIQGKEKDFTKYSNPDNDPRGHWMSDNLVGLATKDRRPNLHYDLIDPETGINYGCPEKGWRYEKATMRQKIQEGRIIWPSSPDGRPRHKKFQNELQSDFTGLSTLLDVPNTSAGTQELRELFGKDIFDFPKPTGLIKELVAQGMGSDDLILDFFAGSCTTADAVLNLNREDGGKRRFIMIQLPEPLSNDSVTRKAGYSTIADIGKDRIKRVIKKLKKEKQGKLELQPNEDLGFRSFVLDRSNYDDWQLFTGKDTSQLELRFGQAETPLIEDWTPENLLTEILLLQGFPLDSSVKALPEFKANQVKQVTSEFVGHHLYICLDKKVKAETVAKLSLRAEDILVCLDSALSDESKVNLADRCNLKVI